MQSLGHNPRKSARKRRTSSNWEEYQVDEDYVDSSYVPPKRSRRIRQATFSEALFSCQRILTLLMQHKVAWPFNTPVDPIALNIPDYFEKIKQPMDFGTIQKKLDASQYEDEDEFAADVRLVFTNCWTYNAPDSDIHAMATTLSTLFEKQFKNLKPKQPKAAPPPAGDEITEMRNVIVELRNEHQKLMNELTKLIKSPAITTPPPLNGGNKGTKKKSKKEKVKVEVETFTIKQKKELTEKINKLTPEDLQGMVDLLSSEIPESERQNGELEIDLEKLSVSTLQKLDQFVNECLKKHNISIVGNGNNVDDSSSSDSDSSSSDSSDSESENEKGQTGGKENEAST